MHGIRRIRFAAKQVMLTSNFGYEAASLTKVFGTYSTKVAHDLELMQRSAFRSAKRKHEASITANMSNRLKFRIDKPRKVRDTDRGSGTSESGCTTRRSNKSTRDQTSGSYLGQGRADNPALV